MKLSIQDADDVTWSDHPDFDDMEGTEEIVCQDRWTTYYTKIVKHTPTDTFYRIDWAVGSTEYQECDTFDSDPVTLVKVEPYEKTITAYRKVE